MASVHTTMVVMVPYFDNFLTVTLLCVLPFPWSCIVLDLFMVLFVQA